MSRRSPRLRRRALLQNSHLRMDTTNGVQPILWNGETLQLLDQRPLPHESVWVDCHDAVEVEQAIRTMIVRGAPAIGVCAAFGLALASEAAASDSLPAQTPALET